MKEKYEELDLNQLKDFMKHSSSDSWDDLCENCSSIVKAAGITNEEIDKIVKECKKA